MIKTPANSPPQSAAPQMADSSFQARDSVTLSSAMQRASQTNAAWTATECKADAPLKDLNMRVLKIMVERVTGKKNQADGSGRDVFFDCDGQVDQLSSIKPGSAFLALDRNQDDHINDGSELFGPRTGQGFTELAAFDKDDNDWIDENDSIYDRLRIWTRDDKGESRLFGLGEKGIGAICLKHLHTPFDLKNQANELLGQIKSTGVFLEDSGRAGTIQELYFVV